MAKPDIAEQGFVSDEHQLKVRADVSEEALLALGARKLASAYHEDVYFVPRDTHIKKSDELIRLRKDGDEDLLFTYKGPVAARNMRNRLVISKPVSTQDARVIHADYREVVRIHKKRRTYLLDELIISLDNVEGLGNYIEFEARSPERGYVVDGLISRLGLEGNVSTTLSYFELALARFSPFTRLLYRFHDVFGGFVFGISSAVLTTLGVIVGLNAATDSRLAVLGGIASVAFADSFSDALGIYTAEKAERGSSSRGAMRGAVYTFLGKLIFTLSFAIPFLFLSFSDALFAATAWGIVLLVFMNAEIAFVQEEPVLKTVAARLLFAVIVIAISYVVGGQVAGIINRLSV